MLPASSSDASSVKIVDQKSFPYIVADLKSIIIDPAKMTVGDIKS